MDRTSSKCDTYTNLSRTFRSNYFPRVEYDWRTHTKSTYTNQFQHNVYRPNVVSYHKKKDWLTNWSEKNTNQTRSDRMYEDRRRYKDKPVKVKLPKLIKRERSNSKPKPVDEKELSSQERKDSAVRKSSTSSHENVKLPPLERWRNLVSPKRTTRLSREELNAVNKSQDNTNADPATKTPSSKDRTDDEPERKFSIEENKEVLEDTSKKEAHQESESTDNVEGDVNPARWVDEKVDSNGDVEELGIKESELQSEQQQKLKEDDKKQEEVNSLSIMEDTNEDVNNEEGASGNSEEIPKTNIENELVVDVREDKNLEETKQLPTELKHEKEKDQSVKNENLETIEKQHVVPTLEEPLSSSSQRDEMELETSEQRVLDVKENSDRQDGSDVAGMVNEVSVTDQSDGQEPNTGNRKEESKETVPGQSSEEKEVVKSTEEVDETINVTQNSANLSEEHISVSEENKGSSQEQTSKEEDVKVVKEESGTHQETEQAIDDKNLDDKSYSENISDVKFLSKEKEKSTAEMDSVKTATSIVEGNGEFVVSEQSSSDHKPEVDKQIETKESINQSEDEKSTVDIGSVTEKEQKEVRNGEKEDLSKNLVGTENEKVEENETLPEEKNQINVSEDGTLNEENAVSEKVIAVEAPSQEQNLDTANKEATAHEQIETKGQSEKEIAESSSGKKSEENTYVDSSTSDNNEAHIIEKVIATEVSPQEQNQDTENNEVTAHEQVSTDEKSSIEIAESSSGEKSEENTYVDSSAPDNNEAHIIEKVIATEVSPQEQNQNNENKDHVEYEPKMDEGKSEEQSQEASNIDRMDPENMSNGEKPSAIATSEELTNSSNEKTNADLSTKLITTEEKRENSEEKVNTAPRADGSAANKAQERTEKDVNNTIIDEEQRTMEQSHESKNTNVLPREQNETITEVETDETADKKQTGEERSSDISEKKDGTFVLSGKDGDRENPKDKEDDNRVDTNEEKS